MNEFIINKHSVSANETFASELYDRIDSLPGREKCKVIVDLVKIINFTLSDEFDTLPLDDVIHQLKQSSSSVLWIKDKCNYYLKSLFSFPLGGLLVVIDLFYYSDVEMLTLEELNLALKDILNSFKFFIDVEYSCYKKYWAFYNLLHLIKGTTLIEKYNSQINTIFIAILNSLSDYNHALDAFSIFLDALSILFNETKEKDFFNLSLSKFIHIIKLWENGWGKFKGFSKLISYQFISADFMRNNFADLMKLVNDWDHGWVRCGAFSSLVYAYKKHNLIQYFYSDFLDQVRKWDLGWEKVAALTNLIFAIKGSKVLNENSLELLEIVKNWGYSPYQRLVLSFLHHVSKIPPSEKFLTENEKIISFRGVYLPQFEVDVLQALEDLVGKQFEFKEKVYSYDFLKFSVKNNRITEISLSHYSNKVERFYRSYRIGLSYLPEFIGLLTSLKTLSLSYNSIFYLPESLWELDLEYLYLNSCGLTELTESIANFKSLLELDISGNFFRSFPEIIVNLKSLKRLRFIYNDRLRYNPSIKEALIQIPETIRELKHLEYLNLQSMKLTSLPQELGNLTSLKELDLNNNRLKSLPEEIGNLVNLKVLYLDFNSLKILPDSIGNLTSLEVLGLFDMSPALPESILNLKNLEIVYTWNEYGKIEQLKERGVKISGHR